MDPRLLVAGAALALALAGSCSGAPPAEDPDPAAVLDAWHLALAEGRPADAFALLDESAREGLDLAAFLALYEVRREALVAEADSLRRLAHEIPPEERARVALGDGEVELVRTRAGWRLVGIAPPPAPANQ